MRFLLFFHELSIFPYSLMKTVIFLLTETEGNTFFLQRLKIHADSSNLIQQFLICTEIVLFVNYSKFYNGKVCLKNTKMSPSKFFSIHQHLTEDYDQGHDRSIYQPLAWIGL